MSHDVLPAKAANTSLGYESLPDLSVSGQAKAPLDNLRQFLQQFGSAAAS
ncbi:hypothetical protein WDV93_18750 [Pantoea ananatis]